MLNVTSEYKEAILKPDRYIKSYVIVNSVKYEEEVKYIKYNSSIVTGDSFTVGTTNASTVEIDFTGIIENFVKDYTVKVFVGVMKTGDDVEYIPLGEFLIDEIKIDRNSLNTKIKATDKMKLLNKIFESKFAYPAKLREVVQEICNYAGVRLDSTMLSTKNVNGVVGKTCREILSYLAQIENAFVIFNRKGGLEFRKLSRTNYKIAMDNYYLKGLELNEVLYKVSGITADLKDKKKTIFKVGTDVGSQIELTNPIMTQEYLNGLFIELKELNFKPYRLKFQGNPALEVGDWVQIEDKDGSYVGVPILDMSIDFNGGLSSTISADVKGSSSVSYAYKGSIQRQIELINQRLGADGTTISGGETEPQNAKEGDTWFKPNGAFTDLLIYENGEWVLKTSTSNMDKLLDKLTKDEIISKKFISAIAKIIELDASKITSGYLDTERFKAGSISSHIISDDAKSDIKKGLVTEEKLTELMVKQNEIETLISETTAIIDNLIKNKIVSIKKNNFFKENISLEKGKVYNFKFSSQGNCEVYVVFTYKDDKRRYEYRYPKKFINKRLIGGKYSSTFYSNHILSFKVPNEYKDSYIIYKAVEDSDIKDILLGEHIGQYNADRITRLKQDLDGFKITAENNINKVKSEFNVKADEINSKVSDINKKISTEISQSTNEIKLTINEMKEDLKNVKNLCKETSKEERGKDIFFACEELLQGQKYKVIFKAKNIESDAEYKVWNSDCKYKKLKEINEWVFEPNTKITRLNLYYNTNKNSIATIYDVQIYKFNNDPRIEELQSEIKQNSEGIQLKVSKNDLISQINQSAESVKIVANKIELDGDVVAQKLNSKRIYGTNIEGGTINGAKIKIGNYGFLQPVRGCLQINVPEDDKANYGVGVQINGKRESTYVPRGLFIYRDPDFSKSKTVQTSIDETLLTVQGTIKSCFRWGNSAVQGTPVMTNMYVNDPIRDSDNLYSIRFMGFIPGDGIYFSDGSNEAQGAWYVKPDATGSDKRLKENIEDSTQNCLELIEKIHFKSFDWKKDKFGYVKNHTVTGIIADELEELDSSLVYYNSRDEEKTKYIDDFRLLAVSTKAVQELNEKVKNLIEEVKSLKLEIAELKNKDNI